MVQWSTNVYLISSIFPVLLSATVSELFLCITCLSQNRVTLEGGHTIFFIKKYSNVWQKTIAKVTRQWPIKANVNKTWTNQNTNKEHATGAKRKKTGVSNDWFWFAPYWLKSSLFALIGSNKMRNRKSNFPRSQLTEICCITKCYITAAVQQFPYNQTNLN